MQCAAELVTLAKYSVILSPVRREHGPPYADRAPRARKPEQAAPDTWKRLAQPPGPG